MKLTKKEIVEFAKKIVEDEGSLEVFNKTVKELTTVARLKAAVQREDNSSYRLSKMHLTNLVKIRPLTVKDKKEFKALAKLDRVKELFI